jgi:hypothetical protein
MSEPTFTIHAVPIADYSTQGGNPFPPVAADDDAQAIAEQLAPYGGVVHHWAAGKRDAAWVKEQLARWADRDGPRSSILLWVGHGESDGNDAWLASFDSAQHKKGTGHNASELADHLDDEWSARRGDAEAWTLVVIEACGAERFIELLAAAVLAKPNPPERFALLAGGGRGSSFLTAVPAALRATLKSYEGHDDVIRIGDLVGRLESRLDPGKAILNLGRARPLPRPPKLRQGITAPLDILAELKTFIADLPADQRGFFIPKAQGTDPGELTWYFEGRQRERRAIADWLRTNSTGLLVVTGPAGSGKSAVLGNVVVHTNPKLRELLIRTGRVDRLPAPEQPPDNVFDAAVLLTGLPTSEVVDRLAAEIGLAAQAPDLQPTAAKMDELLRAIATRAEPLTVLVDALDEAQEPLEVATAVIRRLAAVPDCRVVVGSRRSTNEGPDLPEPMDSKLLDALKGVGGITTITVDHDPAAVSSYVKRRLSDARPKWPAELRIDDAAISAVARSISSRDRHFLYARLAVHELIARPELLTAEHAPQLNALLARDHRSLFSAAVRRLAAADPDFVPLLDALAHARGRGLPRANGVWATVASALADRRHPGEGDLDRLRDAAAPYIMLDGENGQSTYRLAHQTFAEHFHAQPEYGEGHRRIATVLADRYRSGQNGWADGNFYAVRYLIEHLVADPDRIPPDAYGLADLVTDAGWLVRAVELLGIDQTVDVIRSARIITDQNSGAGKEAEALVRWMSTFQVIDAVERTLRRSRTALALDPAQLPGLIHARLHDYPNAAVAALGETIGTTVGGPWLRMVEGQLEWAAALESTYGSAGKVRGLGFGQVGDRPVVAIAIDTRVVLWDPRTGVPDVAASIEVGHRPTAVAVSVINRRPVVVTSAGYDGLLEVWDAHSGERLASAEIGLGHAIGVGRVNGRLVIAGVPFEGGLKVVDALSLEPVDVAPGLEDRQVRGFGVEDDGALLVLAVEDEPRADPAHRIVLVDPSGNREIWRTDPIAASSGSLLDVMAGGRIGAPFVIAAGIGNRMFWLTEGSAHVEQSPYDPRTRAIAVGVVDGQGVVASAPDYDGTALVQLQEIEYDAIRDGVRPSSHRQTGDAPARSDRFVAVPVPDELGNRPARDKSGGRPLRLDRPEDWPHSVAAVGELDGVPVLATGSVEGAVWIWDARTLSSGHPRTVAGPFVQLPPYIPELGWDLLHAKPGLELVTSVALGNLPGRGPVVAAACGGKLGMYSITDGERFEIYADASAVECVALGPVNGRTVLVTGSTGGNLTVWDPVAGSRVAGLALEDPLTNIRIENERIAVRTAASGDYLLELIE